MKCLMILSVCVAMTMSALLPEHHMTAQDMCGSIPDLSFLRVTSFNLWPFLESAIATDEVKPKLLPHLLKVRDIYHKYYINKQPSAGGIGPGIFETRGLLDSLGGLVGDNSKLSTLLKAADALSKAKGVFDEVKNLAPSVHDHLKGSIKDVHDGLQDLIDSITNEFMGTTTPKSF